MKRIFDLFFAILLTLVLIPLFLIISIYIKFSSRGPIIYWSKRVGQYGNLFDMPKFRTMKIDTPEVETNLLRNPEKHMIRFGSTLRKFSLDELPQLYSIITGKMSFVGPRPALHNQIELIDMREKERIDTILPGITGLAQINGRDNLNNYDKVRFDKIYLDKRSMKFDIKILFLTFLSVIRKKDIKF